MKKIATALVFLGMMFSPLAAYAGSLQANLTASNPTIITCPQPGDNALTLQPTGTWTGTLTVSASLTQSNPQSLTTYTYGSPSSTSITANGVYQAAISGGACMTITLGSSPTGSMLLYITTAPSQLALKKTTGTVTSVGLTAPADTFSVSGSPVTGSGTLGLSYGSQTANTVHAGPTSGGAAAPTWRALVSADIPALNYVTSAGLALPGDTFTVSGSPVTSSGTLTGAYANQNANVVHAGPTSGGSAAPTWRGLVAADIPGLPASQITSGTLVVARGGTNLGSLAGSLCIRSASTTALAEAAGDCVTNVTASGNLASSGGTTPAITITNSPVFTGTLSAGSAAASGAVAGDVTAAEGATGGIVYLGTNGTSNLACNSTHCTMASSGYFTVPETRGPKINQTAANSFATRHALASGTYTFTYGSSFASTPVCVASEESSVVNIVKAVPGTSSCVVTSSLGTDTGTVDIIVVGNPN